MFFIKTKKLVLSGVIAAVYVVITVVFQPISFGPMQLRVSEALTILPFIEPLFIPGLYVGVLVSNLIAGLGAWDIWFGSFLTLIAAILTWKMPNKYLAALPPILVNAFGVSAYVAPLYEVPYWPTVLSIGVGQAIVLYLLGIPLLKIFEKYYKGKNIKINK